MSRKPEQPPSEFWQRMADAWRSKGLPHSQNGVATALDMSQGSTRRWYVGDGYPEIDLLRKIARKGGVTIDYLLDGTLPKSPINPGTDAGRLLSIWEQLDYAGRTHVLDAARAQLAPQGHQAAHASKKIVGT